MFTLREYQQHTLNALRQYFQTCVQLNSAGTANAANVAYYQCTLDNFGVGMPYNPVPELSGLPYVCLRIPTGGGKTFVACHAVASATQDLLQADQSVVLWLVPSNAIREQTLNALKDRRHPYRLALEDNLGAVTVLDISEALSVTRATLDTSTAIIVSTIQAFRVEDTEGRKVYESSGALMDHFSGYPQAALDDLETYENGTPIYSLANVLKLHRPVVIVDEAHNARTELSFTTLARFNPSCIVEFTATPDSEKNPSNVLYSVSAAELKAEDMIKMPILLEARPNWRELLADAIAKLNELEARAEAERQATGEFIRPVMLLQAQANRGKNPITVDVVEQCLMEDFNIPAEQIARATGADRELEGVDILAQDCPVRFVITIQALREGWDCPFAYVLCSVAEMRSSTAVEQILGRVMRLPHIKRKQQEELNQAYAFAASANFAATAESLIDGLVQNGFNRIEAKDMVVLPRQVALDLKGLPLFDQKPVAVAIEAPETPALDNLPAETEAKVHVDGDSGAIILTAPLDDKDVTALKACYETAEGKTAVEKAVNEVRTLYDTRSPAERGETFSIPVLAYQQGELPLGPFEETHFKRLLPLSQKDAILTEQEFPTAPPQARQAKIDVQKDQLKVEFITDLHQQMRLLTSDQGWDESDLAHWLDRTIPQRHDILPSESGPFLVHVIRKLLDERGMTLEQLVHHKYRLRAAIVAKIEAYRESAQEEAFQLFLDPDTSPLTVTPECSFTYDPQRYSYNQPYTGGYTFKKHYYPRIGAFDSAEEEQCARYIDALSEVAFWVRNPARGSQAFWLQTSTDRFYPDFVCQLHNSRYLVVEYKGADRWSNDDSKEKRAIGELWEKRGEGACLFVMPKGRDFDAIEAKIA
jgi:type III restriction enzyme